MSDTIQVKATARGFANGEIQEEGSIFSVAKGRKASWYEPVAGVTKGKTAGKAARPAVEPEGDADPDAVDLV